MLGLFIPPPCYTSHEGSQALLVSGTKEAQAAPAQDIDDVDPGRVNCETSIRLERPEVVNFILELFLSYS